MRRTKLSSKMTRRSTLILTLVVAVIMAASLLPRSSAQNRDRFTHSSAAHKKLDCASCHKVPTGNWVAARGYPDVAQFPGHVACANCHRQDFFVGNKPVFCAGCHSNVSPRGAPLFPFPVASRSRDFSIIFPHSVHQDVIAWARPLRSETGIFVNASFTRAPDDAPKFNNCAICHETATALPKFAARTPTGQQPLGSVTPPDTFAPKAQFFKSMPSGHATCFECHYQGVKPVATNCAGCHRLTASFTPSPVVKRYSLKFDHAAVNEKGDTVHAKDCMTCHVRISGNTDLKTLTDADVPIMACTSCHNHAADLKTELDKRADSVEKKQAAFNCAYCHTSGVGAFAVPPSHEKP